MRRLNLHGERGTAVTETLMLTWLLILFVAATLQLFRVNQSLYSAIVRAQTLMFDGAWTANCFDKSAKCIYNSDGHAQVRWDGDKVPEIYVPTVGMFRRQLVGQLQIKAWPGAATPRRDGYKRTRMGAGTYYPICQCLVGECFKSLSRVPSGYGC